MSAGRLVKRLRAAVRGLPIGGALAARFASPSARPRSPPIRSRPIGRPPRNLRRASSRAAATWPGSRSALAPGAITYWRDPGDAGLPPTLDFSASDNVASVEPEFPAPKRIKEADGGEAFGYDGDVVFPLRVKPRDPAKPATLKLNADFAVCEKVCLPAKAHLELTLPSAAGSPHAGAIDAALAAVPAPGSRRRISARSRRSARIAGASARRARTARRATCSSRRPKAGGSRSRPRMPTEAATASR